MEEAFILEKGHSTGLALKKEFGPANYVAGNDIVDLVDKKVDALLRKKIIPFKELQDAIAPEIKDVDIFISFSHRDDEYACMIAKYLSRNFKVFVDPSFWGSVDRALRKYFENNRVPKDSCVDKFRKIMEASEIFHALLADSLKKTIQNSTFFLFIKTENSFQTDGTTYSPWLYLENTYCLDCLQAFKKPLNEELERRNVVKFPLDTSRFSSKTEKDIADWIKDRRSLFDYERFL